MSKSPVSVIASDFHVGTFVCRVGALFNVLEKISHRYIVENVIGVGDIFDRPYINRSDIPPKYNLVRESLCSLGKNRFWIPGNHDRSMTHRAGEFLAADAAPEFFVWEYGGERYLMTHGDQFDFFEHGNTIMVEAVDRIYRVGQKLVPRAAQRIKESLATYGKVARDVARGVSEKAAASGASVAFYGHMHNGRYDFFSDLGVHAYNIGCATDTPSSLILLHRERHGSDAIERMFF